MDGEGPHARVTLEQVLAGSADGVFVLDSAYRCVLFSPACERITGYAATEMLGTDWRAAEPAETAAEIGRSARSSLCPSLGALRGKVDPLRKQTRIRRADGSVVWVEGHYTALRDEHGGFAGVLGVLRADDLPSLVRGELLELDQAADRVDQPLDDVLAFVERRAILTALRRAAGRRSQAAREMGISRSRLYRRMEALGIHPREDP